MKKLLNYRKRTLQCAALAAFAVMALSSSSTEASSVKEGLHQTVDTFLDPLSDNSTTPNPEALDSIKSTKHPLEHFTD